MSEGAVDVVERAFRDALKYGDGPRYAARRILSALSGFKGGDANMTPDTIRENEVHVGDWEGIREVCESIRAHQIKRDAEALGWKSLA